MSSRLRRQGHNHHREGMPNNLLGSYVAPRFESDWRGAHTLIPGVKGFKLGLDDSPLLRLVTITSIKRTLKGNHLIWCLVPIRAASLLWRTLGGISCLSFQMNAASLAHAKGMPAIEAIGTRVAPRWAKDSQTNLT